MNNYILLDGEYITVQKKKEWALAGMSLAATYELRLSGEDEFDVYSVPSNRWPEPRYKTSISAYELGVDVHAGKVKFVDPSTQETAENVLPNPLRSDGTFAGPRAFYDK